MPDQKEPNASHGVQLASKLTFGSIALKLSEVVERTMRPSSLHDGDARDAVVARPMADWFDPNVDPA
jgi:hypothetical protein